MVRTMRAVNGFILFLIVAGAIWAWPRLPERVPLHFGLDGLPDAWGSRSLWAWFGLPVLATVMSGMMLALTAYMRRHPRLVNLPGGGRLDELPPDRREPIFRVMDAMLCFVNCEVLVILGLIQWASWRAAAGLPMQGLMLAVLLLALLSSPILMAVFFTRLQAAMDLAHRGLPPPSALRT